MQIPLADKLNQIEADIRYLKAKCVSLDARLKALEAIDSKIFVNHTVNKHWEEVWKHFDRGFDAMGRFFRSL